MKDAEHFIYFMGKQCKIDLPALHDFGKTGARMQGILKIQHVCGQDIYSFCNPFVEECMGIYDLLTHI